MSDEKRYFDPFQYCCIDLMRSEQQGFIATATGGVWLRRGSDTGCLSGFPKIKFCPHCGAEILVRHLEGGGWEWEARPR